jgi:hypothetical protein
MATAEQVKSLVRSYSSDHSEHFYTVALQIAAHEARKGHISLAQEIRNIVDEAKVQETKKIIPFSADLNT